MRREFSGYEESKKTQQEKDHSLLVYETRKKKLQLMMKRNEREEDNHKKKCYHMLLEFQAAKSRIKEMERRTDEAEIRNEQSKEITANIMARIREHATSAFSPRMNLKQHT